MEESKFWVMHIPVLCTSHIRPETSQWLSQQFDASEGGMIFTRLWNYAEGFLLYVGSCDDNEYCGKVPPDLLRVLQWTEQHGFEWLRLDGEGDELDPEILPLYEWP